MWGAFATNSSPARSVITKNAGGASQLAALIATAIGLFAAIPATIFYNHFSSGIDKLVYAMEYFASEFETDIQRLESGSDASTGAV